MAAEDHPLVTIGIPVYNGERYLRQTLDSAVAQTYTHLEILVSDNASTDGTADIVREYTARDSRVQYTCNATNFGPEANFHRLLHRATGKYFAWFFADDYYLPTFIERMLACFRADPSVVACISDITDIDADGVPGREVHFSPFYAQEDWKHAQRLFFECPPSFVDIYYTFFSVYRTAVLQQVESLKSFKLYALQYSSMDVPFLAKIAVRGRIAAVPESLICYRRHEAAAQTTYYQRRLTIWEKGFRNAWNLVILCKIAATAPLARRKRLALLCHTLFSFPRACIRFILKPQEKLR